MIELSEDNYDGGSRSEIAHRVFVAQACARRMIAQGVKGSLIQMGSQMGQVSDADRSLYYPSKCGLEGMSEAFALDLAGHGFAPTQLPLPSSTRR